VKENGFALRHVSDYLKTDREFVLEAVKNNGRAFLHVSDDLKNDKQTLLEAVKSRGATLGYASEDLENERLFVLEAVTQSRLSPRHVSKNLNNNRETGLEAAKKDGPNHQVGPDQLKNDRDIVLIALYSRRFLRYSWRNVKQFEILSKEKQFELVKENSLDEFEKEALHFASENGFAWANRIILHEQNHLLAHTTIDRAGNKYSRPLHRAAKEGHLEACKELLDIGGGVKSNKGKTPLELAKQSRRDFGSKLDEEKRDEFDKVIELLHGAEDIIKTGAGGAGNALDSALKDERSVVQVEWSTCLLTGWAGKIGAVHSIIVITVSDEGKAAKHDDATECYFVENVDSVIRDNIFLERQLSPRAQVQIEWNC
jgi:hypothetical protein